jgi:hypothetical protein
MVPGRKWSVTSSFLYLFFGEGQREGPAAYRYYRSIVWQQSSKGKFSTSSTLLLDGQIVDRLAAYFQLFLVAPIAMPYLMQGVAIVLIP